MQVAVLGTKTQKQTKTQTPADAELEPALTAGHPILSQVPQPPTHLLLDIHGSS